MLIDNLIILLLIQYCGQRPLSRKNMHITLNSIFRQEAFIKKKNMHACFFLIKASCRNIELRVMCDIFTATKKFIKARNHLQGQDHNW